MALVTIRVVMLLMEISDSVETHSRGSDKVRLLLKVVMMDRYSDLLSLNSTLLERYSYMVDQIT
jgi:hypothetical protein